MLGVILIQLYIVRTALYIVKYRLDMTKGREEVCVCVCVCVYGFALVIIHALSAARGLGHMKIR